MSREPDNLRQDDRGGAAEALCEPAGAELSFDGVKRQRGPTGGFTLIELLVVIAVIGILAGLVLSVTGQAAYKMKLSKVKTELSQYETAIEAYKAKVGSYPPDHRIPGAGNAIRVDPLRNQLYYELTGTTNTGAGYMGALDQNPLPGTTLFALFGVSGFANCSTPEQPARNFLPSLVASQSALIPNPGGQPYRLLTVSVPWPLNNPRMPSPIKGSPANPVRYNSSSPTNSTTYDLWAEVPIGNRVYVLGNWNNFVPH